MSMKDIADQLKEKEKNPRKFTMSTVVDRKTKEGIELRAAELELSVSQFLRGLYLSYEQACEEKNNG